MTADVVFDLPLDRPFSYQVPDALRVTVGQRVSAPLGGRPRVGVVVALRPDVVDQTLKPIQSLVEPAAIVSRAGVALGRWIADESLSSWGSTLSALLPPPPRTRRAEAVAPVTDQATATSRQTAELWTDAERHERLLVELANKPGGGPVAAPEWGGRAGAAPPPRRRPPR